MTKTFGPTFKQGNTKQDFPADMRTQLWPLCCGAKIISGFKNAHNLTLEELVKQIEDTLKGIPDFQVFAHETMKPKLTFLTLNYNQMASPKIMTAVEKCGFFKVFEASPRGRPQGFFIKDDSGTYKPAEAQASQAA